MPVGFLYLYVYEMKKSLEFLRYCLNNGVEIPKSAVRINWMRMMAWAESQAIVGIIFQGIQKGGKELQIPFDDLMEWVGYVQQIEGQNSLLNKQCMLLKGQGYFQNGFFTDYPTLLAKRASNHSPKIWSERS